MTDGVIGGYDDSWRDESSWLSVLSAFDPSAPTLLATRVKASVMRTSPVTKVNDDETIPREREGRWD